MSDNFEATDSKKIFFLFVPPETDERIVKKIVAHEYEAYTISEDAAHYLPILQKYLNSIIFAYETNCPRNVNWKDYYEKLSIVGQDGDIKISTWFSENGVLRVNENLSNFPITLKTIDPKSGADILLDQLLDMLKAMSARGRRNYIRIKCNDGYSATFSIKILRNIYNGVILDISSIGMACTFNPPLELMVNAKIEDVQLRLNGHISHISGTIFGKRDIEGKSVYVIIFDFKNSPETRTRINEFVYTSLQRNLKNMKTRVE